MQISIFVDTATMKIFRQQNISVGDFLLNLLTKSNGSHLLWIEVQTQQLKLIMHGDVALGRSRIYAHYAQGWMHTYMHTAKKTNKQLCYI